MGHQRESSEIQLVWWLVCNVTSIYRITYNCILSHRTVVGVAERGFIYSFKPQTLYIIGTLCVSFKLLFITIAFHAQQCYMLALCVLIHWEYCGHPFEGAFGIS